jgi:hypothetical protein
LPRKPNHETSPDFGDEEHAYSEDVAYLNPEVESKQTPLLVSSLVADWTERYGNEAGKLVDTDKYPGLVLEWDEEYRDGNSFWVPENRWTHEVVRKPVQISEDIYAVYLDADAYMQKLLNEYKISKYNEVFEDDYIRFITRTLYKYIDEPSGEDWEPEDEFITQRYHFIHRWLPSFPAIIHYWSDAEIEDKLHIRVESGSVDCTDEDKQTIQVPFRVKRSILPAMPYIKHDSLVYYIRIEKV